MRPDGTVKVLDFGLAKAMGPAEGGPAEAGHYVPHVTAAPTMTSPAVMPFGYRQGTPSTLEA